MTAPTKSDEPGRHVPDIRDPDPGPAAFVTGLEDDGNLDHAPPVHLREMNNLGARLQGPFR